MRTTWNLAVHSLAALLLIAGAGSCFAQVGSLTVKADKPGVRISPMLYGLMTEEINHAYDGGLYAELIQNRAFKDSSTQAVHWFLLQEGASTGAMALDSSLPIGPTLPASLKLTIAGNGGRAGIANDGYWGIPVQPNTRYRASFYARASDDFQGPITVDIESSDGKTEFAKASVAHMTSAWKQYFVTLKTGNVAPSAANRFVLSAGSPGTVWFGMVSLFPPTFNNRPNGTRPDLMNLMGAMKPAFLRLPGGNYLEGNTIAQRFNWKETLGNPPSRPGHQGPWGYPSTDGMGLLEFLEWCQDLHMEPILAVFAGYALQGEHIAAGPLLTPFVQDALDEIEYMTGDVKTRWGGERAKNGHPAAFPLRYVEIGNEDWFDRSGSYDGRFAQFFDAIKKQYPKLEIIATAAVKSRRPDVIDDHYYRSARDMERDIHHYDRTDRNGPKIFVGEWASTEGSPTPTLKAALGDAAWLTGLERNSDIVPIECYAPLLVNVNPGARQWGTNLIGYDAIKSFGSPSYYAQTMFANNRGDVVLPVEIVPQVISASTPFIPKGGIGVGTWATQAEYKDIRVTHGDQVLYKQDFSGEAADWKRGLGTWSVQKGALRQTSRTLDSRALAGDANWADYTYRLKARKLGGAEGFLILFHVQDSNNYIWWNVGGWNNTRTAMERTFEGGKGEIGNVTDTTVETGRWYDIRIEMQGRDIRAYLDDKLITTAVDSQTLTADPLYSTASRDEKTGEVILKVVNASSNAQELLVNLEGLTGTYGGKELLLQGQPNDVNTVDAPRKVSPKTIALKASGPTFSHTFPPYSVSVLRLRAK